MEQNPRLAISIFYPSSGGSPLRGLDLYAPCQVEVAAFLREMGVDLENLNVTEDLTTSGIADAKRGAWPVVLLSPGFGVERDMYLGIISKLVPKGYIIVTISAPHESVFTVYPDGGYIKQGKEMAELKSSDYNGWYRLLESRSRSITVVMDYLDTLNRSDPEFEGLFDLVNVTAVGHSLGGAAVLEVAKLENRIKAAILLDPSFHLIRWDGVTSSVPVLLLRQEASTYGAMAAVMNEKIAYDYIDGQRNMFKVLTNACFYRVNGAQHMSFSDVPLHYGDLHVVPVHAVTVEATTAFMEAVFQGGHLPPSMALQFSGTLIPINSDGDPI
ncbi:hypothetical protein MUG84_17260 [Paenibacillus sp. KQZ6P-2]|uniref:Alpha/beta hydrolase n=1 Tax=Paenibacillus mangrovi TaxID=2931978 RepID=A0A9X1WQE2_9BACL|nr:hypothetical protein [Paenibacillus mangrovi]MCJ8013477.1 hypothetical protein [Paenibacillus mangrovi]